MKITINEKERGLLFKNGKFQRMLDSGRYRTGFGREIETVSITEPLFSDYAGLDTLLKDPRIAQSTAAVEVGDQEIGLHFVNGVFAGFISRGKKAFWSIEDRHTFQIVSTADPAVGPEIPRYIFEKPNAAVFQKLEVAEYEKARLFYDQKFQKLLEPGTYFFWRGAVRVEADRVDTRLSQLEITGQEILTADRIPLRVNFFCGYRTTDYVKSYTEVADGTEQLHVAAQMALREYVGQYRLDELLEKREALAASVLEKLRAKAASLYLEVTDAGIKDIILPGEIRSIMNTVLVAEKKAQANVIARREEVASTRSLLNTARLMDENKTLYKLKELEYLEKICANVGNISVGGEGSLLSRLSAVLSGTEG